MQLVAYGAQDVYLSGNPQITFFKIVYRRHTNFAMESIEQTFNGAADFNKKVTCTISRNGDLIHRAYLRVSLPTITLNPSSSMTATQTGFRWLNWVGHILIKSVELEVGGQRIDKHYGDWLHIWNELTQSSGHALGYARMVGNLPFLNSPYINTGRGMVTIPGHVLWIPLEFWFCRNPGLALPLIALQYHEVKVNLEFADWRDCVWAARYDTYTPVGSITPTTGWIADTTVLATTPSLQQCSLFVDYIYLDTDERRRFAQSAHEYLIEQLQYPGEDSSNNINYKGKLNFNHPVKELIWVTQPQDATDDAATARYLGKQPFNYSDGFDPSYQSTFSYASSGPSVGGLVDPSGLDANLLQNMAGGMPVAGAGGAMGTYLPTSYENGRNPSMQVLLQLNGHDRFSQRDGSYFNLVQPYQHHENVPSTGINVYSFALQPEQHQPSGSCNMSRIDNATLNLTLTANTLTNPDSRIPRPARVRIYAVNYNVFRVMSGMGGTAYSN
jgi:hypothetical protein